MRGLAADPNNQNTIISGCSFGIFISYDAGLTWTQYDIVPRASPTFSASAQRVTGLAIDGASTMYVAVGYPYDTPSRRPGLTGGANGVYKATVSASGAPAFTLIARGWPAGTLQWFIDNVSLYEGAPEPVSWWQDSLGDQTMGVIRVGTAETQFKWTDYNDDSYRIYRSTNAANIRGDASSTIIRTEPDTNAVEYTWATTVEGAPPSVYFYKIYGFRAPCGESDPGQN